MPKKPKTPALDLATLEYIISLCDKKGKETHSRMVWAAWEDLKEELTNIKECINNGQKTK